MSAAALLSAVMLKYFQNCGCVYQISPLDLKIDAPVVRNANVRQSLATFNCQCFVISQIGTLDEIEQALRYTKVHKFNSRQYLFVADSVDDVHLFLAALREKRLAGVAALINAHNDDRLAFYGQQRRESCDRSAIFGLNVTAALGRQYVFREERRLLVSTFYFPPYVSKDLKSGAELSILFSFAQRHNITLEFERDDKKWGYVKEDFKGDGSQYRAAIGEVDISLGGFYRSWERYYYNDISEATLRNGVTLLVPKPKLSYGFLTPLYPLAPLLWWMFLLFYLLTAQAYYCFYLFYRKTQGVNKGDDIYLKTFGVLLQQNLDTKLRGYGCFLLLLSVTFSATYSCRLSSITTRPRYHEDFKTFEDVGDSDLNVIGYSNSYISAVAADQTYRPLTNKYTVMDDRILKEYLATTKRLSLAIDHLDLGYSLGQYSDTITLDELESFKPLEDDLYFEYCVVLGTKHSRIMPLLNTHILQVKECGLDSYWQAEAFRSMDYKMQLFFIEEYEETLKRINLGHMAGTYGFLGIGLLVSLLQFVRELFSCHLRSQAVTA